jgi:penicillin-binding protein 1A
MKNQKPAQRRRTIVAGLAFLFCGILLIPAGIYLYLSPQLPDVETLKKVRFETPLQVLSSDGRLIAEFGEKHTAPLTYDQIPPLYIKAILAAEDDRFFEHEGINYKSLLRAFVQLVGAGGHIQSGGSTLTMQVAKNYFLSQERSFSVKFTELLLAKEIEDTLTKQEILTLYVNKIFLGHRSYGIGAAAEVYYSKRINELNLAQLAMIAGLPKAPSAYNPVSNPQRAIIRRNWILDRMLGLGYINQKQHDEAVAAPVGLNFHGSISEVNAPYLAEMVRNELVHNFGDDIYTSGYKVYTTVSSVRQNAAAQAVIDGLLAYDQRHGWRGPEAHGQDIDDYYYVGGLPPAKVTVVNADSVDAVLADNRTIHIPWEGLKWARPFKGVNSMGPVPKTAGDILKVDDIIRVQPLPGEKWKLVQIPQVQGLLISLNAESGGLEAVVGGFDYTQSKFNRALQGWRQVGSTIKPFIYANALEHGFTPATLINDGPLSFGDGANAWHPSNSDGEFLGPIRLRQALYMSRNMVSIRLLQSIGISSARDYAARFGLPEDKMPQNLTLALGSADVLPIQMVTGYAALANGGYRVTPYFIDKVVDLKGSVLFQAKPARVCYDCDTAPAGAADSGDADTTTITGTGDTITVTPPAPVPAAVNPGYAIAPRIMNARTAYQIDSILADVILHGTATSALSMKRPDIAGKTGTTNEARDAWFSGFNPKLVTTAWVGFDDPQPLGRLEFGGYAALPIWIEYMSKALAGTPVVGRPVPAGLTPVRVNKRTGQRTGDGDPDSIIDYIQTERLGTLGAGLPDTAAAPGAASGSPQVAPEEIF